MARNRLSIIALIFFMLAGCGQSNKPLEKPFDKVEETLITNFSKSIFSREIINSQEILDTLKSLSDSIYVDTANYTRTPKATIYTNSTARTYFQIFEKPKGTITAIAFYKNHNKMNVAEYFANGQVMCKFSVTDDGVRSGTYFCYYENGKLRKTGYYRNGTEIGDSSRTY